ncbi:cilia-and flagella-associated protein 57 [Caerostris extrusa]|uniref:Cilia-and flagella-associated protein 57 n=1 Tax=Caerostris extrusa TaxID=172846 RepID=A0AAV4Y0W0_CAEEX|nr:cilia-and flagella-associated protein 57 [Caerostris extrusa]
MPRCTSSAFAPSTRASSSWWGGTFLRLYRCKDEQRLIEIALHDQERTEKTFHCVAWMSSPDRAMIGTSDGKILIFQNITLLREVLVTKELIRIQRSVNVEDRNVTCILLTSDGLMCSHGTTSVLCFKEDFKLHKVLNIPHSSSESRVVQLAMNLRKAYSQWLRGTAGLCTTAWHSDLTEKDCEDDFRVVQDYQLTRGVICADTIQSVSLQVACSDAALTIRDFSSSSRVVLRGKLPESPCSISLCPQATSVVLGYEGAVKVYNIVFESLVESYSFETDANPKVCFSPSGHLIAFTKGSEICLYYSSGFKAHTSFQRHKAKVQNLIWRHDKCLLSSDAAGAIYEWDLLRKGPPGKHTLPEVIHTSMATPKRNSPMYFSLSVRMATYGASETAKSEVTAMVVVDELVLVGSPEGKLVGFELSLRFPIFEISHHIGSIVHLVEIREGTSIIALDTYGIASTWKFNDKNYTGATSFRTELLINVDKKEEFVREIRAMEVMLRDCTEKAELERQQLRSEHEQKEAETLQKHRDIQSALQSSLDRLKDELKTIKEYWETKDVSKIEEIQREKEENESDFQLKMVEEEKCLLRAKEERTRLQEDFEQSVVQRQDEKAGDHRGFWYQVCATSKKNRRIAPGAGKGNRKTLLEKERYL